MYLAYENSSDFTLITCAQLTLAKDFIITFLCSNPLVRKRAEENKTGEVVAPKPE